IKVTSVVKMDFPQSGSALVMNYLTDISVDEKQALREEVDEIWTSFQKDVENANLKAGLIRATHLERNGFLQNGKGYGYVFIKRDDNQWHCLEEDKGKK